MSMLAFEGGTTLPVRFHAASLFQQGLPPTIEDNVSDEPLSKGELQLATGLTYPDLPLPPNPALQLILEKTSATYF